MIIGHFGKPKFIFHAVPVFIILKIFNEYSSRS